MKKLKWSDFEWYKKKSKVIVNDSYLKCSEKRGLDQKLIFPFRNYPKYLTFSTGDRYTDLHISFNDKSIPKKPVFEIRQNKLKNIIKKQMRIKQLCKLIPNSNKKIKNWILVDPYSTKFLHQIHTMNGLNIMPQKLLKIRINSMRNHHNKILFAYDSFGQCLGIVKCDHRKNGFRFIPIKILEEVQRKVINLEQVNNILRDEGIEVNKKIQAMWDAWNTIMKFFNWIHFAKIKNSIFIQ